MDSDLGGNNVWDDNPSSPKGNILSKSIFNIQADNGGIRDEQKASSPWEDDIDKAFNEEPKRDSYHLGTGSSAVTYNSGDDDVNDFQIQNELAHTMKSIMLSNDGVNGNNEQDGMRNILGHVHYGNERQDKSDNENPFIGESNSTDQLDITILKEKKNELFNSLTKDVDSHPFLRDSIENEQDNSKVESFFEDLPKENGDGKDDSALNNLLTLSSGVDAKDEATNSKTKSTKYQGVVSPNRKINILRPRRVTKTILKSNSGVVKNESTDMDPLFVPLLNVQSDKSTKGDVPLDSPKSRKQKLINESEALLFNIKKDKDMLGQNTLSKASSSSSSIISNGIAPTIEDTNPSGETFEITVGDPIKVGELTNAHVVYTITTRTSCELFNMEETVVTRRYSDFLWLYHQLLNNHPGYIIPPPPEKQVYGRFDDKFIENRRQALENMLIKVARRKIFQRDLDFVLFLQSENFAEQSKEHEAVVHHDNDISNDSLNTMAQMLNVVPSLGINEAATSSGFFSTLIGLNIPKYVEEDPIILERQAYVESLDTQLRHLTSSLDMILEKRDDLTASLNEVTAVIQHMCDLEVNSEITEILSNFEELETKIKELLDRANLSQVLTFGSTIDEYVRLLGSVRNCFENRLKICNSIATLKQHQEKKEHSLAKFRAKNQSQPDKIKKMEEDMDNFNKILERQVHFKEKFDETFKSELKTFEFRKVKDFKDMIEIYWESLIENQKLLIELWESFYEKCKFDTFEK